MTGSSISSSRKNQKSGSPQSGGPGFLSIGKLQRTHGVKGEILMEPYTDFPERIKPGNQVFIGQKYQEYLISSVRASGAKILVSFSGLTDCDQVSILRNQIVYIKTEDANLLPDGQFYHHEIIGMSVEDEHGKLLGTIQEILITGANDVYVISTLEGSEILLPAIRSAILSIDNSSKRMKVHLPEWE